MKQTPKEIREKLKEKGFSDKKIDLILEQAIDSQDRILKLKKQEINIEEIIINKNALKKINKND